MTPASSGQVVVHPHTPSFYLKTHIKNQKVFQLWNLTCNFLPLLLHSQLYLWGSPVLVRFSRTWSFFNPTIEVVAFHLCGWCMLGVFLLPAFTRLGHECQDLLSPCDGRNACVHRLDLCLYSHPKEFGETQSEPMLTPRGKSPLPEAQRIEPAPLHHAGQQGQHTTNWAIPAPNMQWY